MTIFVINTYENSPERAQQLSDRLWEILSEEGIDSDITMQLNDGGSDA